MDTEKHDAQSDADSIEMTPSQATDLHGDFPGEASQEQGRDLGADMAALEAQLKKAQDDYLYAQAEIENSKKRFARQADERVAHAQRRIYAKFLPVLDNLQRALRFDNDSAGLREGLNATLRGFESVFAGESVVPLEVAHKPFDPKFAEAIATRETSEFDDGVVIEEMQRGYRFGEEVLRPALVVVAHRVEAADGGGATGV